MDENINDGGPAFPVERQTAHGIAAHTVGTQDEAAYIAEINRLSRGMSLRDQFAIAALPAVLRHLDDPANDAQLNFESDINVGAPHSDIQLAAEWAYLVADAMLKARGS